MMTGNYNQKKGHDLGGNVNLNIKVPSWNAAYRISNNRIYKTDEAKAFQDAVRYAYEGDLLEGDVEVFVEFGRFPLVDIDNGGAKLVLDALEGVAYKKDRQVVSLTIDRQKADKGQDWLYVSVISQ